MLKAARCATLSRGPYSPAISTRLATLVRSKLAEKVCRQQRPLYSREGWQSGFGLATVGWEGAGGIELEGGSEVR